MIGNKTKPSKEELGNNTFPIATPCTNDFVDPQKRAVILSSFENPNLKAEK